MKQKNIQAIAGIASLLMVLLLSAAPNVVAGFVETFCAPLLFICMGYALSATYADRPYHAAVRVFSRFYPVFVRWSLFFLVVAAVLGSAWPGLGAVGDGHAFLQQVWNVLFALHAGDIVFCNFFWLFRAALVGFVGFCVLHEAMQSSFRRSSPLRIAIGVVAVSILVLSIHAAARLTNPAFVEGGYRELVALLFVSMGHLFVCLYASWRPTWHVAAVALVVLAVLGVLRPGSMSPTTGFLGMLSMLFTGTAAFLLLSYLTAQAGEENVAARALQFAGRNAHYTLSFAMFAIVLAVSVFGIPGGAFSKWFPLLWAVGAGAPLSWIWGYRRLERRFGFDLRWSRLVSVEKCKRAALFVAKWVRKFFSLLYRFAKAVVLGVRNFALSFMQGVKDVVNASNPKDE